MSSRSSQKDIDSTNQLIDDPHQETGKTNSLENGRTTQLYYLRFMKIDNCLLRIIYCNFAILVVYYEYDYNNTDGLYTNSINILLYGLTVCAILGIIMLYFRQKTKLYLDVYQKKQSRNNWSLNRITKLISQIIIQILQPYPWINNMTMITVNYKQKIQFPFKVNYLLVIMGLFKIYQIWKIVVNSSAYATPRCNRLAKMYMCQANHTFALKCMFKDFPMKLVTICFFISIVIFSFALRVAQRSPYSDNKNPDFTYLSNSIWLTVITLCTVGYGDISPQTTIGRAIVIVLVLWGAFIVSIMVAVLNNIFQMDQRQLKVLSLIKKLQMKKDIRNAAAQFIQHFWKKNRADYEKKSSSKYIRSSIAQQNSSSTVKCLRKCLNMQTTSQQQQSQFIRKFQKKSKNLFTLIKDAAAICQQDDVYQDMARQFQCLQDDLKSLNNNQQQLTGIIHDKIQQKANVSND